MAPGHAVTLVSVTVSLHPRMVEGIAGKAREVGIRPLDYCRLLLEAAYTARVKPQGDREMEEAVAAVFAQVPASQPVSTSRPAPDAVAAPVPVAAQTPEPVSARAPLPELLPAAPSDDPAPRPAEESALPAETKAAPALPRTPRRPAPPAADPVVRYASGRAVSEMRMSPLWPRAWMLGVAEGVALSILVDRSPVAAADLDEALAEHEIGSSLANLIMRLRAKLSSLGILIETVGSRGRPGTYQIREDQIKELRRIRTDALAPEPVPDLPSPEPGRILPPAPEPVLIALPVEPAPAPIPEPAPPAPARAAPALSAAEIRAIKGLRAAGLQPARIAADLSIDVERVRDVLFPQRHVGAAPAKAIGRPS